MQIHVFFARIIYMPIKQDMFVNHHGASVVSSKKKSSLRIFRFMQPIHSIPI